MKFRDRDAPISHEGLIFRTYGYDHPKNSCFCDLEYAPENMYAVNDPRAIRDGLPTNYFKFYFAESAGVWKQIDPTPVDDDDFEGVPANATVRSCSGIDWGPFSPPVPGTALALKDQI